MSRLNPNSMPAERAVGCSFAETMESAAKVIANGGEVFGTPTISFGAILNGTTDRFKFKLQGHEFNSPEISIVFEFWPYFETDNSIVRYLYDTNGGQRFLCLKHDNANNNVLLVLLGQSYIAIIPENIYSPYWEVNARNVLVISGTSGATNVWLNGVIIASSTVAWSAKNPPELFIGSGFNGANRFKGKIGQVKIFKSLLTAQDAQNFCDNSTYNYLNDALVHLPVRAWDHDPDNTRTLDMSGNGYHGTLVGSPVKQQKRGYLFDGVDDAFTGLPALTGDYTVNILADNEVNSYNTDTVYESLKTPGGFSGAIQNLMVVPSILTPLQEADNRIQMIKQVNYA